MSEATPDSSAAGAAVTVNLDGLTASSDASDHKVDGFHHRHVATKQNIVAITEAFRAAGYFLEMITCEDRREDLEAMRLVYTYNRFDTADRHLVLVDIEKDIPGASAPTVCQVFPSADWFEREVYDMYGVRFDGHPDLKRILLPDDADFHALLKDFGRIEDAPDEGEEAS